MDAQGKSSNCRPVIALTTRCFVSLQLACLLVWPALADESSGINCKSDSLVQAEISYCAKLDYAKVDFTLNQLFARRLKALSPERQQQLRIQQRKWLKGRDAACLEAVGEPANSGTIWPAEYANCLTESTLEQIEVVVQFR